MKTDSELSSDVLAELLWDPLLPEARVGVTVNDGVVSVSGELETYAEKVAVRRAVERVHGVKAIALDIRVVPSERHQQSDAALAAVVAQVLQWQSMLPCEHIKAQVAQGWVTLSGTLDWDFQRRALERLIRPLKGVVGITDLIELRAKAPPMNVSQRIQDALTRQAMDEAQRIEIQVKDSVVTLQGCVHSWAERHAAEGAAWAAPGVREVNNLLTVEAR